MTKKNIKHYTDILLCCFDKNIEAVSIPRQLRHVIINQTSLILDLKSRLEFDKNATKYRISTFSNNNNILNKKYLDVQQRLFFVRK